MRFLGVDYGHKRVGLAISDETGQLALPLETISGGTIEKISKEVARIASERGARKIIVGVPLKLDGQASPQTEYTLKFIVGLRDATTVPVEQWDERLTSVQAERAMLEADASRKTRRANIDKLAAQLMLQNYLDAHAAG